MVRKSDGEASNERGEDEVIPISPQEVFSEICCDWPLVSAQEAAALVAVLPPSTVRIQVDASSSFLGDCFTFAKQLCVWFSECVRFAQQVICGDEKQNILVVMHMCGSWLASLSHTNGRSALLEHHAYHLIHKSICSIILACDKLSRFFGKDCMRSYNAMNKCKYPVQFGRESLFSIFFEKENISMCVTTHTMYAKSVFAVCCMGTRLEILSFLIKLHDHASRLMLSGCDGLVCS
jgi:hypothetical protein